MLEVNGIPPKLTNQTCESLLCQQYWHDGKLEQEVDVLLCKVNERWHQLYFESGTVFWRSLPHEPIPRQSEADDRFQYPLVNVGEKYAVEDCLITDVITEPLLEGARVTLVFEEKGNLCITHSDNTTRMNFIKA
ncbi:MAG: hypothetical protein PVJ63_08400 [Thioalkalispiraceae bacterium]|jgi:hypothetical protein